MEKALVFLAAFCSFRLSRVEASTRDYYIAAVEIGWDYTESVDPETSHKKIFKNTIQKYIKAVYREYTDSTYTIPKPRPAWSGIQGPVIVAQAGDKVVVHFKNLASQPYSISPVGVTYWKQSEGEGYDDSTAGQEKEDDAVSPGGYYEYVWDISIKDGPTRSDPECLTYSYSSRVDTVRDMNSGLIGSLLICKPNAFTEDGKRRNPAFVLLFAVFDESRSWYGEAGERRSRENFRKSNTRKEYHTINGYINSTLPGLTLCHGRGNVFWHLIGMGTAPAIHTIQFHEHTLKVLSHRKITVAITPMTFITAEMKPTSVGRFLITCNIVAHRHAGMNALFIVETCPDVVLPEQRNAKYKDYGDSDNYDYDYDKDLFNIINIEPKNPKVQARSSRGRVPKTWHHYIAAEEIIWNYAPHLKHTDSEMQSPYLPEVPHHLEYKYKKVVYVEYSDESFTKRVSPPNTLLGPLLKGKVNDQFHITFKNLASRPFNIYPNGLTKIDPLTKNANAESNLQTMGVLPNTSFEYIWKLTAEDGPLDEDPQCLTQFYQSTVSPERDLATGLVGTLLICKYDAIDSNGRLLSPDRELSLIFAIFDENRSWCFEENMIKSKQLTLLNNTDSEFYKSNVIHSVNGIMFSGRQFVMCQTDVTFWHIANVGTQSDFLSVYFTGNLFEYQGVHQSVLTLFPMTATTVYMETELNGEWEISAFDSSRKSRGMSILYSVRPCNSGKLPTVDQDEEEYVSDYLDYIDFGPRGSRPLNRTITVRVCKKRLNATQFETHSTNKSSRCQLKNVTVAELKSVKAKKEQEEEIPLDILKETGLDIDSEHTQVRLKRQTDGNWTEDDLLSEEITGHWDLNVQDLESQNLSSTILKENNKISSLIHSTKYDPEGNNEILMEPTDSMESETKELLNDPPTNIEKQAADFTLEFKNNTENDNLTNISLSVDYDDYSQEENGTDIFYSDYLDMRSGEMRSRHYYIAAEETTWNYGIRTPHQFIKAREMRRGKRKFLQEYKKVVFRAYRDKDFQYPVPRGELEEHLGIMGPFIRAEINELLTVVFKNKASRPYSFHLQGVYDRSQGAGFGQTLASDSTSGVPGEAVAPGEVRTYSWRITKQQGPSDKELSCKTGAYYSTLDKDKDLQSGLVGPLVICKPGTLQTGLNRQPDVQEFALLFHTFDETRSWYLKENLEEYCVPPCRENRADPWFYTSNSFASINGYVAETLPGLLVAQHQLVRWHLLNLGSDGEYHAVHFHSLPFIVHTGVDHRMGVYQLFPGVFGTLEMRPPTVGTWLVECTVADYQLAGMRAKVLVYNPKCILPLGMKSRRIHDSQITASNHFDGWEPRLARLDQSGFINAWMGQGPVLWIQVDLLKPMLLHGVKTQGVRAKLRDHYVTLFNVSYSMDLETWTYYRGNSTKLTCLFFGNMDSVKVKENTFFPPFVARYIRIHPVNFEKRPALRMELLGCDVNSCSLPLGLQTRQISDSNFSASSVHSSLFSSWSPFLARLHQEGHVNAWRPKNNNPHEWLQVDLGKVRRIAGVVTQGARSLLTQMMVTEFSVTVSQDGHSWSSVLEEDSQRDKIFIGNNDPEEEALTVFDYPLFGRFLRIHPLGWINDIALRLEILGCDTQQLPS